jgi:hypothetical protein
MPIWQVVPCFERWVGWCRKSGRTNSTRIRSLRCNSGQLDAQSVKFEPPLLSNVTCLARAAAAEYSTLVGVQKRIARLEMQHVSTARQCHVRVPPHARRGPGRLGPGLPSGGAAGWCKRSAAGSESSEAGPDCVTRRGPGMLVCPPAPCFPSPFLPGRRLLPVWDPLAGWQPGALEADRARPGADWAVACAGSVATQGMVSCHGFAARSVPLWSRTCPSRTLVCGRECETCPGCNLREIRDCPVRLSRRARAVPDVSLTGRGPVLNFDPTVCPLLGSGRLFMRPGCQPSVTRRR